MPRWRLTIPMEVRLQILRELLYSKNGVLLNGSKAAKNSVYSAILACCRQLHGEGKPILRSNRLIFDVGICGQIDSLVCLLKGLRKL